MSEIRVQYKKLEDAVDKLRKLAGELRERGFVTTKLMNESRGKTCEELNETYEILCEMEQSFRQLLIVTAEWLEKARSSFWEAELESICDVERRMGDPPNRIS
ncbi:MAG: hypothetical protein SO016_11555 [Lachnospiraceae bacterium]|nr:YwqI/YxiC family protein [Robinsoniella sp.]MDY3767301.1 hypothetical protein [Lachnospiraceae bacterium]